MQHERPHEFRNHLDQLHLPNRRDPDRSSPESNEVLVNESWAITFPRHTEDGVMRAARDLQDYFLKSMDLLIPVKPNEDGGRKQVALFSKSEGNVLGSGGKEERSYTFCCGHDEIRITGNAWQGVAQGVYFLEDLMNLREAPILAVTEKPVERSPLFSPRMVHSGWGLDQYPDAHLLSIAHHGFDAIIVFVKGVDQTTHGFMDFNALVRRAGEFALDVYFYSYLDGFKHPDDEDADQFFDHNFGEIFKSCPNAKGLILVSESCEFPTKDPRANPQKTDPFGNTENQGIATAKKGSGWWPCSDYPQWLEAVKNAVHRQSPEADVIFWTYGFGVAPSDAQRDMVRALPTDTSLLVTFEMYEQREYPNHTAMQADYSITFPGPSRMFRVEAEAAHDIGLRLYSMTNTGGRTWDGGFVPYIPTPNQWFKRFDAIHEARNKWNLSGLMDSHHFGWYPSVISECAKWSFWSPEIEMKDVLGKIAFRIFGKGGAELALKAWCRFSDAINSYTPGFGDQNGPLRIGAAYPLVFHPYLYPHIEQRMDFPRSRLCYGLTIVSPLYKPEQVYGGTACGRRFAEDIKIVGKLLSLWESGNELMREALAKAPERNYDQARREQAVCEFFYHGLVTMLHVKRWWVLNKKLEVEADLDAAHNIMDELENIAQAEMKNVKEAIPLAEENSILGWEPRMDYAGGACHLKWKVRQLENLLAHTLPAYRLTLQEKPSFIVEF